jgi:hypothetical protein
MHFLVVDPLRVSPAGRLHRIGPGGSPEGEIAVGYATEVTFNPAARELLLLESDAEAQPMKYFLRTLDADRMTERSRREIPIRPMYAGFPGRSAGCAVSASGRFVYFLRMGPVFRHGDDLTFRLMTARWDRKLDAVETGRFYVDSCHVDYGIAGDGEDDLFIHLSCECASTVAFGSFGSDACEYVRMEDLPRREHGPLETNGSWLDKAQGFLYCVNRIGTIYRIRLREKTSRVFAPLRLGEGKGVPVHQIFGAAGEIHIGVAEDNQDVGLGMVREIWSVSADTGEFLGRRLLPFPIMSFVVTPDGKQLAGVNPYSRTVYCMDRETGDEVWRLDGFGAAPGEIVIVP